MLFVGTRPVLYFSFDSNAGLTLHRAVGAVNDEDVSKVLNFSCIHLFYVFVCIEIKNLSAST